MIRQREVLNLSLADLNADPHVALADFSELADLPDLADLADLDVDPIVADGPPDILTEMTLWVGQVVLIDGAAPL